MADNLLSGVPPPPPGYGTAPAATANGTNASSRRSARGGGASGNGRSTRRRPPVTAASPAATPQPTAISTDSAAKVDAQSKALKLRAKKKNSVKASGEAVATTAAGDGGINGKVLVEKAPPTPVEALVNAIRSNDLDAFRAILAANVDLDVNKQLTPDGDAALVDACRYARHEMVTILLSDRNANVNVASTNKKANRQGLTPLIAACMTLRADVVDLLLHVESSSPKLLQMYGRVNPIVVCTLFSVANGHTEEQSVLATALLEKLLSYAKGRGKLDDVFKFETEKGNRLAHIVAGLANWRAIKVLREFGADLGFVNRLGKTPLSMIESNAFERRSFAFCVPPKQDTNSNNSKKKRGGSKQAQEQKKSGKGGDQDSEAGDSLTEPESAADKQVKLFKKKIDRKVEISVIARTFIEISKSLGFAPIFYRKGDSTVGFPMRCYVLAHVGFANLANEFARAPEEKKVYLIDGLVYTFVSMYSASLKRVKEYRDLWQKALDSKTHYDGSDDERATGKNGASVLTPEAFKLIIDDILTNRSLSRRVQTMAMVLMHLESPYAGDKPLSSEEQPARDHLRDLRFYRGITDRLYRSGTKLLFCIFDRTDIEEDESYDEEIEFHLLISLTELFLQFFAPFAQTFQDGSDKNAPRLSATASFQLATKPIKNLLPLIQAGLHSLDDPIATPQRFSLIMHVVQVFEQLEASFLSDEAGTVSKLYKIMKQFVKGEATKKRIDHNISSKVHLLQTIANALPMPSSYLEKVHPLKEKIDILIRSDPKIVGLDLYSLAPVDDIIRLEHKVDYLGVLAEEQHGGVSVSISRASASNHVDFILQQILSTSARNIKGELNITLINEPGVGVGVIREFFQIVQKCFFNPSFSGGSVGKELLPSHVSEIGSQWLQLARSQSPSRGDQRQNGKPRSSSASDPSSPEEDATKHFPLFEFVDKEKQDELRITVRKLRVSKSMMDAKKSGDHLSLSQDDVIINQNEVDALKKLYQCAGRLMGLAIRNHQPLNVNFPLALWKFIMQEKMTWEEYCGSNEVFKRSLQFILDHNFDASPLDMHFEFTTEVVVVADELKVELSEANRQNVSPPVESTRPEETTATMEMQLKTSRGHTVVTNQNKKEYVEARARQHFFRNEIEYYKKLREGLLDTIQKVDLKLFRPDELRRIARGERKIDFDSLMKGVLYSKGSSAAHGVIKMFWMVVDDFDQAKREQLLTFWSGSPQPPLFGFESNHRSMSSDSAVWYIDVDPRMKSNLCPMANTCDRRLILPEYPSEEVLKEKLEIALTHGAVGYDRM